MNNIIGIQDLIWVPVTVFFIYLLAAWKYQKYQDKAIGKYFFWGLHLKLFASLAHFAYHYFVYQGGDTFQYFRFSKLWVDSLIEYPIATLHSLIQHPAHYNVDIYEHLYTIWYRSDQERRLLKITGPLALLNFKSFISIGLWLSFFAYWGLWRVFKTFSSLSPNLIVPAAIASIFFPSVVFWSSSISKDAVTMGCVGLVVYASYSIFITQEKTKKKINQILILFPSLYLLSTIKGYIIVALIPSLAIWILLSYRNLIENRSLKILVTPITIVFSVTFIFLILKLMSTSNTFSLFTSTKVYDKIYVQYNYLSDPSRAGSVYDLGTIEPNLWGIVKVIPKAITVSLFRPFLWEARNPTALLAALESFIALLLTCISVFRLGFFRTLSIIYKNPFLVFCITFTLIFGAAMGLTSGNFGTLMRYKIPCMPFFIFLLGYLYMEASKSLKNSDLIELTE